MRLAFITPEFLPPWGGVGVYSLNLIKELSEYSDIDIHVITPRRGKFYDEKKIEDVFGKRIKVHQISEANDDFFYNFKFQIAVYKNFEKLNKKYKFDIVHSANLVQMPDIFIKFKTSVPSLVTAHTTIKGQVRGFLKSNKNFFKMATSEKGSILAYPIIYMLEKIYLRKTKNLITVSNKFAREFIKYGYKGNVYVTHNGISTNLFNYEKIKNPYVEFPELKKVKYPIILFAGRIITQKGIEVFVKAIKRLQNKKVHFVIAGRGDVKRFKKLLKKYNIKDEKYDYLGFVENHKLPSLYKISSIFVLPSYYENFPISLLEAMSMKCCCIATDVGAVDEIIDNKINGIIIKPGSSKDLARNISSVLNNEKMRVRMAEKGFKKIINNFDSKTMAIKTKKIYEKIALKK